MLRISHHQTAQAGKHQLLSYKTFLTSHDLRRSPVLTWCIRPAGQSCVGKSGLLGLDVMKPISAMQRGIMSSAPMRSFC